MSGKAKVLYLENNVPVGFREIDCSSYTSLSGTINSAAYPHTAFFCPTCGEIWARAIYDFQFSYQPLIESSWVTEIRRCPQHGDGTFLSGYSGSHLENCSRELLAREALILCLNEPNRELGSA